jgi:hypothetical protein
MSPSTRAGLVTRQIVVPAAITDDAARITAKGLVSQLSRSVGIRIT